MIKTLGYLTCRNCFKSLNLKRELREITIYTLGEGFKKLLTFNQGKTEN